MAMDDLPEQGSLHEDSSASWGVRSSVKVILIALVVLVVAEIYSFSRIVSLGKGFREQEAKTRQELTAELNNQLSARMMSYAHDNQQQLEGLKEELDQASQHLGAQKGELRKAREMVTKIQADHDQQVEKLRQEIALKADQQQLGALTLDVSNTKTDLNKTKKNVDTLANNFGMERTRFGTLIARNHNEIDALRKLGQRDYYEFTLVRHKPVHLADIGLDLKKTNKKHHSFTIDLLVDDVWIRKDHRTVNEPIFFAPRGTHTFCELVVNKVDKGVISGYISTPKNLTRMASRSEGPSS